MALVNVLVYHVVLVWGRMVVYTTINLMYVHFYITLCYICSE